MKLIENLCHCTGLKLTDEQIKKLRAIGRAMDRDADVLDSAMTLSVHFSFARNKSGYSASLRGERTMTKAQQKAQQKAKLRSLEKELEELHKQNLTLENIQRMNEIEVKCFLLEQKISGI